MTKEIRTNCAEWYLKTAFLSRKVTRSISPQQRSSFQRKVLDYYPQYGRSLPWRATTDPYKILVSEIMLQQTQVDRVIPYYTKWVSRWSTITSLAQAPRKEVLHAWLGLGYNNRAVRLHAAASSIAEKYQGNVLKALEEEKLPGIGSYTKNAVRIFAANADLVTVDTNIRRILIHEFKLPRSATDKELEALAFQCLPRGRSREWHNALMDYGATLLTSRKTGIKSKTSQSVFEGSDRQLRAQLLRIILSSSEPCTVKKLAKVCSCRLLRLTNILDTMVRDGLLEKRKQSYAIKN